MKLKAIRILIYHTYILLREVFVYDLLRYLKKRNDHYILYLNIDMKLVLFYLLL